MGALLGPGHQLGLVAQGQDHVGQAGREHRHLLGFGGNGHAVDLHRVLPGGGGGNDVGHVGAAREGNAGDQQAQGQGKQAPGPVVAMVHVTHSLSFHKDRPRPQAAGLSQIFHEWTFKSRRQKAPLCILPFLPLMCQPFRENT